MQVQKISDTIQKFDGASYYKCGQYFRRKGKLLHRIVWEYHNGPIPEGCDIHHIDMDRSNNDIDNLLLMDESEHERYHSLLPDRVEMSRKNIVIARQAADKWHGTPDGFEFHSKHAKEYWSKAEEKTYQCTCCGKEFRTRHVYGPKDNRFCSNNCKSAWRRKQGYDNEIRICPVCGKRFAVNKYAKQVCCSSECARWKRWRA